MLLLLAGRDGKTGQPRGFAFVKFSMEAEAARAVQLNGEWLLERPVHVKPDVRPHTGPCEWLCTRYNTLAWHHG